MHIPFVCIQPQSACQKKDDKKTSYVYVIRGWEECEKQECLWAAMSA